MYNARRWARRAERSERVGRIAEARERWQRAAIHAESLVARHPRSRWVDDALLLRGRALVHLSAYTEAQLVLERAVAAAREEEMRRHAQVLLGRTYLALRAPQRALAVLDSAAESLLPERRAEALLYRGRSRLALGEPAAALEDFAASTHPQAPIERARAGLLLRDTALALGLLDSLVSWGAFAEADWLPTLDSLGAAGAVAAASRLVDSLAARGDLGRGQRARVLLSDGDRLLGGADTAGADRRFESVERALPDSAEGRLARLRRARIALAATDDTLRLDSIRVVVAAVADAGGTPAREAAPLIRLMAKADSLSRIAGAEDAHWFAHAEFWRDSLHAPALAARLFGGMVERYPDSPWTPKAILAAVALLHPSSDSLLRLLEARYADSPYTVAARGGSDERYAVLEDSLRAALDSPGARRPGGPTGPRGEEEDEIERVRTRVQPRPAQPRPTPPRPAQAPPRPASPPIP
jgi:predicted negative regulator of RcsB-dependent stress response